MVSDLKTSTNKGCKIAAQKRAGSFLVSVFLTPFNGLCAPTSQSPMSKLFDFRNPWGKVMKRSGLRFLKNAFAYKGCKIAAKKKKRIFFHLFTPFERLFAPTSQSPMSKLPFVVL